MRVLGTTGGVGRALVVVSTVFAMLSAGVESADGPIHVRSRLGDACLDAPSWIGDVPVVINPCNDSDFQRWNLNGQQLESVAFPGKCLTPQDKTSVLHLEMCRGAMVQHWNFQPDGQVKNDVGNCLTAFGGPAPGTRGSGRLCKGEPGPGWDIAPLPGWCAPPHIWRGRVVGRTSDRESGLRNDGLMAATV